MVKNVLFATSAIYNFVQEYARMYLIIHTAILRKVVGKNVHAIIAKGNQYTVHCP